MNDSDVNNPQPTSGATPGDSAAPAAPVFGTSGPRPSPGQPPRRPLPPQPPQPPRRSRTGLWIVLGVLGVGLLCFAGIFVLFVAALFSAGSGSTSDAKQALNEEVVSAGGGAQKIAQIELNGIIMPQQVSLFGSSVNMVERLKQQLRQAAKDPTVVAVLLVVDSPGGAVTASDELWNEVKKVQAKKKVVVHMGNLCASGGYYISASADHLIASPTTVTGSIGVIMPSWDASTLMREKLGVTENNITSGPFKEMGALSRPMRDDERAILQSIVDDMYGRFVKVVAEGRAGHGPIPAGEKEADAAVRKIADGRVYTATQALSNGLVDEIGYLEDAQAAVRKLSGVSDAEIIRYRHKVTLMDLFSGEAEGKVNINAGVQVDVGRLTSAGPYFLYLWSPGR